MGPIAGIKSVVPAESPTSRGATGSQAAPRPARQLAAPRESCAAGSQPVGPRPLAAFLSHLIATAHDAPQTRRQRRAAVSEALAAYADPAPRGQASEERDRGGSTRHLV
jgi:hypothetical protein